MEKIKGNQIKLEMTPSRKNFEAYNQGAVFNKDAIVDWVEFSSLANKTSQNVNMFQSLGGRV